MNQPLLYELQRLILMTACVYTKMTVCVSLLISSMQSTERGRKLNAAVMQTGKYVVQTGKAVGEYRISVPFYLRFIFIFIYLAIFIIYLF